MRTLIVAVGTRMPQWVAAGFDEYARRMPHQERVELIEVKPEKRAPHMSAERCWHGRRGASRRRCRKDARA